MSKVKQQNGVPRRRVKRLQPTPAFTRPSTRWTQAARRTPRHGHSR